MNKAIIFVGELEGREYYHLLIGTDLIYSSYSKVDGNRDKFLDRVSEEFARSIIQTREHLEVGIMNGYRIINGDLKRVGKLDDNPLEAKLSKALTQSLQRGTVVLSAASMN